MSQRAWTFRPGPSEPVIVEDSVREAWDLRTALAAAAPGNLFPSRVGWTAAQDNHAVLTNLDGQAASGYKCYPAEIVAVPKSDRTSRPAADMSTEDQILYAAIINGLRTRIPAGLVTFTDGGEQTYDEFERFPLEQTGARYVVEGDAAAFFQYIDYERLATELIGLTGWSDAVEPLVRLLETWMGPGKGIPQGPGPSRSLADIYISRAARRLARAGWVFSRYNDDFRIVASSWSNAREAHYALEEALGEIGLIPAEHKARTYKKESYERHLDKVDAPGLAGAASRGSFEELKDEDYDPVGTRERIAVTQEQLTRARQVMREQIDVLPVGVIATKLIRRSLAVLGSGGSPAALPLLSKLQRRYPHLAQATAGYVRLLMGTDAESRAVQAALAWIQGQDLRLAWQVGWLLNALCFADAQYESVADVSSEKFGDSTLPWFLHGQAALAMAIHGHLPGRARFDAVYEVSPIATRPDLVASVVVGRPNWANTFLEGASESPLLAAVTRLDPNSRGDWQ